MESFEMKLLFSEAKSDYVHYIFPYAIWAFPENGETPHEFFERGFLPSTRQMDRYYLCRSLRVDLSRFAPSSENRRIIRKNESIGFDLTPRAEFDYTEDRREFYKRYADIRFGKNVMTHQRLDNLFNSKITSHVMHFTEKTTGKEVGDVTLFLEPPFMAHYYYAFYDLNFYAQNLGMFMMTSAVDYFAGRRFKYIYLGSCYSENALYKTQFQGAEFFNGAAWSANLKELKALIQREQQPMTEHLFESTELIQKFYAGDIGKLAAGSQFTLANLLASTRQAKQK